MTVPSSASIIAFVSQTGNVMKTTLAAATGIALVEAGIETLAIDLDKEHRDLGASLQTWADDRASLHEKRSQLPVSAANTAEEALAQARGAACASRHGGRREAIPPWPSVLDCRASLAMTVYSARACVPRG